MNTLDILNYNLRHHQLPDLDMDDSITSYYHIYCFLVSHPSTLIQPNVTFTHRPLSLEQHTSILHGFLEKILQKYNITHQDLIDFGHPVIRSNQTITFTPGMMNLVYGLYGKSDRHLIQWTYPPEHSVTFLQCLFQHSIEDTVQMDKQCQMIIPVLEYLIQHPQERHHTFIQNYLKNYAQCKDLPYLPLSFLKKNQRILNIIFQETLNARYAFLNNTYEQNERYFSARTPQTLAYLSFFFYDTSPNMILEYADLVIPCLKGMLSSSIDPEEMRKVLETLPLHALRTFLEYDRILFETLLNIQPEEYLLFNFDSSITLIDFRGHQPDIHPETNIML